MFQFGKYRHEACEDATEDSPDCYFWGAQARKPRKYFQHVLDWVTQRVEVDPQRSTLMSEASGLIPPKRRNQTESQFKHALRQEGWKHAELCVPHDTSQRQDPMRHTSASRACSGAGRVNGKDGCASVC